MCLHAHTDDNHCIYPFITTRQRLIEWVCLTNRTMDILHVYKNKMQVMRRSVNDQRSE